ncbi:hypothetical protein FHG87_019595 [Trinorchestia longiramus]|nr:hypothetical protein FHG87_019595 [Trinorchestia longiramus]
MYTVTSPTLVRHSLCCVVHHNLYTCAIAHTGVYVRHNNRSIYFNTRLYMRLLCAASNRTSHRTGKSAHDHHRNKRRTLVNRNTDACPHRLHTTSRPLNTFVAMRPTGTSAVAVVVSTKSSSSISISNNNISISNNNSSISNNSSSISNDSSSISNNSSSISTKSSSSISNNSSSISTKSSISISNNNNSSISSSISNNNNNNSSSISNNSSSISNNNNSSSSNNSSTNIRCSGEAASKG